MQLFDGKNERCYQFDGVLSDTTDNKDVFKTVGEPLVYSALSGFNGILMCYGQTGTGKNFTKVFSIQNLTLTNLQYLENLVMEIE